MKYPRIYRIPVPGYKARGKHYLTEDEVDELLDGEVVIQEKIDGKLTIIERLGGIVFGEYMKWVHNIHYTKLPVSSESWFIGFDIWNRRVWLDNQYMGGILQLLNIPMVPTLYEGAVNGVDQLLSHLGTPSAYGAPCIEGIVIKRYVEGRMLAGKIVDPQFEDDIDSSEHWSRKPKVMNRLWI